MSEFVRHDKFAVGNGNGKHIVEWRNGIARNIVAIVAATIVFFLVFAKTTILIFLIFLSNVVISVEGRKNPNMLEFLEKKFENFFFLHSKCPKNGEHLLFLH